MLRSRLLMSLCGALTLAPACEHGHIDETAAAGPDAVNTAMPKGAPMPTEAERRQFGEWLACGAP